jgi:hypothetical protein
MISPPLCDSDIDELTTSTDSQTPSVRGATDELLPS